MHRAGRSFVDAQDYMRPTYGYRDSNYWYLFDHLVPVDNLDDESHRFEVVTKWKDNSCSLDVTIMAAFQMRVGRIVADHLTFESVRDRLTEPTQHLFRLMWRSTSELSTKVINQARDHIRYQLNQYSSAMFPLDKFMSASEVCSVVLAGIPQLTFTAVNGKICCGSAPKVEERSISTRHTALNLITGKKELYSVSDALETMFCLPSEIGAQLLHQSTGKCSQHTWTHLQFVVMDRLPHILVVCLSEGIEWAVAAKRDLFRPFTFRYWSCWGREISPSYELVGVIVLNRDRHYVLRWRRVRAERTEIVEMDSVCGKTLFSSGQLGWMDKLADDTVEVMFWRELA
jgi:hypothetical protein